MRLSGSLSGFRPMDDKYIHARTSEMNDWQILFLGPGDGLGASMDMRRRPVAVLLCNHHDRCRYKVPRYTSAHPESGCGLSLTASCLVKAPDATL